LIANEHEAAIALDILEECISLVETEQLESSALASSAV
jgi:hypothetical protein